ncbi:hypothetical protein BDZ45DRAFT_700256 [Acephala macrosclerotiorum]|nr:hypothetical protein BDZ45DRAFT_700256 [Acephala macrosclerotiorum]
MRTPLMFSRESTVSKTSNLPELTRSKGHHHSEPDSSSSDQEKAQTPRDASPEFGLDNTIAADIQPAVVDPCGDISKLAWLGSGFPLGSIVTILTFGKAYGIFNVKWLHITSVTIFAIGSAICGTAPNMNALIVGRVIAGIGGAGMYLGNLNLLSINISLRERPVYLRSRHHWIGALLNAGLRTSFVLASTFGGTTWAWAIATIATGIAQFAPIFHVPLFFQFTHRDTGLQAVVRLMPFIILNIFFIMAQGIEMPFVGYTSAPAIYGYSVLIAIGTDLVAQTAYSIAPTKVKPEKGGDAIGSVNVAQIGGIALALSTSSAVFQNTAFNGLKKVLDGQGFSTEDIRSAVAGEVRGRAIEKIVESINTTYGLVIAAGALALAVSLFLRREKLFTEVSVSGA